MVVTKDEEVGKISIALPHRIIIMPDTGSITICLSGNGHTGGGRPVVVTFGFAYYLSYVC